MFPNASRLRHLFLVNLFIWAALCLAAPSPVLARDCWLSVQGAGLRDGTSPENAYGASEDNRGRSAERCWAETSPDGTMSVLEGHYSIRDGTFWRLTISKSQGGSDGVPSVKKKLLGLGRVSIEGSRKIPYRFASKETGETWLTIQKGAQQLHVENFQISGVAIGISAEQGGNKDMTFKKLQFQDTRQNLILYGHPDCSDVSHCKDLPKESLSSGIRIEGVNGLRYSKRHIRLTHGIFDVLVLNSSADAQFLDGDFAVGFDVDNPSHDIEFRDCSARKNLFSNRTYWNGDGFKSENETEKIRWIRCSAFNNADAGFDIKTPAAVLDHIRASGNGRNIRIWSQREALLTNILSTHAHRAGGNSAPAGLWVQGIASCQNCTISENPTQIRLEGGTQCRLTLTDSLITAGKEETLVDQEDGTQLQEIRTEMRQNDISSAANATAEKNLK